MNLHNSGSSLIIVTHFHDAFKVPFLHTAFLVCYSYLHKGQLPEFDEFIHLVKELVKVDVVLYTPVALFNFRFIPAGIWQTVFVNAAYVFIVEPIGSMIINDGFSLDKLLFS